MFRFLSNGSLDKTFGANGIFVLPNSFGFYAALALQPDGKILLGTSAGGVDSEMDRLTTTGHLDASFGSGGRVTFQETSFLGMGLQPDGRILAGLIPLFGGPSQIARLLSNGSTDTSFGTNGLAFPPGGAGPLEALGSGEILVLVVLSRASRVPGPSTRRSESTASCWPKPLVTPRPPTATSWWPARSLAVLPSPPRDWRPFPI